MEGILTYSISPEELIERTAKRLAQRIAPKEQEIWRTQKEAAKYTGRTVKTLINWEAGKKIMPNRSGATPRYLKSDLDKLKKFV